MLFAKFADKLRHRFVYEVLPNVSPSLDWVKPKILEIVSKTKSKIFEIVLKSKLKIFRIVSIVYLSFCL